jgi:spermidine/putrescine transport system substrate-binding protein
VTGNVLRLIAWRGYDHPEAAAPFLEDSGLRLEVEYVDADEQAIEILKAGGLGAIDAVVLDDRYLPLLIEADLLASLDGSRLPNSSDCLEPFALLRQKAPGGGVWSVPFIWGTHPMAYNASFVPRPPASWLDVLEPEYEGKVAMLDGAIHQVTVWGRVLGYRDPTRITRAELAAAVELAIRVKRQCRARLVSWDELPAVLASGETWIATAGWEAVTPLAAALGADVRLSHTREGAYPWMDSWCIPRKAPNENAAYAWIDWMLGPQAQVVLARNLPCGSVSRKASRLLEPEARELFPYKDVGRLFGSPSYVGMPPHAAAGEVATLADWYEAWDEVRAA